MVIITAILKLIKSFAAKNFIMSTFQEDFAKKQLTLLVTPQASIVNFNQDWMVKNFKNVENVESAESVENVKNFEIIENVESSVKIAKNFQNHKIVLLKVRKYCYFRLQFFKKGHNFVLSFVTYLNDLIRMQLVQLVVEKSETC